MEHQHKFLIRGNTNLLPPIATTSTSSKRDKLHEDHSATSHSPNDVIYRKKVCLPVATISANQDAERSGHGIQRCIIQPIRTGLLTKGHVGNKAPLKPGSQLYAIPPGCFRLPKNQTNKLLFPPAAGHHSNSVSKKSHGVVVPTTSIHKSALSEMYRVSLILIQKEIMQNRILSPRVGRSKTC